MTSRPRSKQCLWARAMCQGCCLPLKLHTDRPFRARPPSPSLCPSSQWGIYKASQCLAPWDSCNLWQPFPRLREIKSHCKYSACSPVWAPHIRRPYITNKRQRSWQSLNNSINNPTCGSATFDFGLWKGQKARIMNETRQKQIRGNEELPEAASCTSAT